MFCVCDSLIRVVRLCSAAGGVFGFWWLFVNIGWFVVLVSCLDLVFWVVMLLRVFIDCADLVGWFCICGLGFACLWFSGWEFGF